MQRERARFGAVVPDVFGGLGILNYRPFAPELIGPAGASQIVRLRVEAHGT